MVYLPQISVKRLLVAGSFGLATAAQAQVHVSLGPRVGENLSRSHVEGGGRDGNTDYRFGLAVGAQATISRGKFALQPALLFSQKGSSTSDDIYYSNPNGTLQSGTITRKLQLNYLTLPLNFTFAPAGAGTGPQFFAGPYVGVLLGGSLTDSYPPEKTTTRPIYVTANGDFPTGSEYYANRFDAGVQAGVGFRFEHLLLQAEYSLGLRNQYPNYIINALFTPPTEYNRSFQASVSYLFDLRR